MLPFSLICCTFGIKYAELVFTGNSAIKQLLIISIIIIIIIIIIIDTLMTDAQSTAIGHIKMYR